MDPADDTPFHAFLQDRRNEVGLKQDELATALGVHPTTVSKYESGDRPVPRHRLQKYAELIQVHYGSLLRMWGSSEVGPTVDRTPTAKSPAVRSDRALAEWQDVLVTSSLSPGAKMILLVLAKLLDRDFWLAVVTEEEVMEAGQFDQDTMVKHWDEAIDSAFVRPLNPDVRWAIQLVLPEDDELRH